MGLASQLECCAVCIEREPLGARAWCLLGQVLCDPRGAQTEQIRPGVRQVWAPPRCFLWDRLFFCAMLPAVRLRGAPFCVLRGLALLYVFFPRGNGPELRRP